MDQRLDTRRPWVAVALSFLAAGLGQIYAGRGARGLILLLLSLLVAPAVAGISLLEPSQGAFWALGGCVAGSLILLLFAVVDAWRCARRAPLPYRLRDVNRVSLYVLVALVGLGYPLGSTFLLRSHFLEAFKVPTLSMAPTIRRGDRILVQKSQGAREAIAVGDLVVFFAPGADGVHYVKRVVGMPGARVVSGPQGLTLDGEPLEVGSERSSPEAEVVEERYADRTWTVQRDPRFRRGAFAEVEVPPGCCFVLSDNRTNGRDSRHFGPVPLTDIVGRVAYRFASEEGAALGPLR